VLRLAASMESRSEHPVGKAIAAYAQRTGIETTMVERFRALPGRGAEADVGAESACIGNHRLFEERRLCTPEIHGHLDAMATASRTAVLVARGGEAVGIIAVADRVRETGRDAVDLLRRQGVQRLVLLTGDNQVTAEAISRDLGLDDCRAELLPEDKVAALAGLRREYGTVAMVGDGVNDAPALAAADVGIVMGAAGSDAALETADVALMADELLKIPYAIRLSRATVANIQTNIAVAIGPQGGVPGACDRRLGDALDGGHGRHGRVAPGHRQRTATAPHDLIAPIARNVRTRRLARAAGRDRRAAS
jgi:Cd2+/Zn2+-exporting ATPase